MGFALYSYGQWWRSREKITASAAVTAGLFSLRMCTNLNRPKPFLFKSNALDHWLFLYNYSQQEKDWKTSFSLPEFDHFIKWLLAGLLSWEDPCIKLIFLKKRQQEEEREIMYPRQHIDFFCMPLIISQVSLALLNGISGIASCTFKWAAISIFKHFTLLLFNRQIWNVSWEMQVT